MSAFTKNSLNGTKNGPVTAKRRGKINLTGLKEGETASRSASRNPRRGECEEVTWDEAVQDFVQQMHGGSAPKTQKFYLSLLSLLGRAQEARGVRVQDFRVRDLRSYIAARAGAGISDRTRRHDAVAARAFCRYCAGQRYMPVNPLEGYAVPRASVSGAKTPTAEEVGAVLAAISLRWNPAVNPDAKFTPARTRTFLSRRNYAIISGAVDTGCRIGEILSLHLADYDEAAGVIHIRKTKTKRPRSLPVSPAWQKAVAAWLRVRPRCESPYLFISRFGGQITVGDYSKQFQAYREFARRLYEARCEESGTAPSAAFLSHFTLHRLRHYAATLFSEAGWGVAQRMLGHSSVTTTQGYVHSGAEHLRGGHAEAGPLARLVEKDFLVNNRGEAAKKRRLL